mgnify:CR=1 FL=1
MEFCEKCDNMYYMRTSNETKNLYYFCKHCNHVDDQIIQTNNLKVYKYSKETKTKDVHINEYTKYDPTLPHVYHIKCPNVDCVGNKNHDLQQDVVYVRYDDRDMKYTYLCFHCDFSWNV